MCVCRGVGRVVVGAEIGFRFDHAAGENAGFRAVNEELAQQTRRDPVGTVFEERARDDLPWERSGFGQDPLRVARSSLITVH
jgi:hypothetical protein